MKMTDAHGVQIKDFGFTKGVHDETPKFLAVKISFRVATEENKKCNHSVSEVH